MYDVIVVGGGPAGSHVAARLAKRGHRVVVLEEHARPGDSICCTGIIGRECLEQFPVPGVRILGAAASAVAVSPSGKTIRLAKDSPQAYVLDRSSLDRALAGQAQTYGAQYVVDCHVENAVRVDGHMRVQATRGAKLELLDARCVVLASGFNPGLIARVGLGSVGDFAVGAQAEVETTGVEEVEVYFSRKLAPGFFAWVVPVGERRALAGLMTRRAPGEHLKLFLGHLRSMGKLAPGQHVDVSYGRVPLRPLRRSVGNGLLAVGDAAGQVKPTTGGGIYYGFLCGDMASEVIDAALKSGPVTERSLYEYERRWKLALLSELRMGYVSRVIFERLSDGNVDELFDVVNRYSLDRAALGREGFSFDWHGDILRGALRHQGVRHVVGSVVKGLLLSGLRGPVGWQRKA